MTGEKAEGLVELASAAAALTVLVTASSAGHPATALVALGALAIVAASYRLRKLSALRTRPEVPQAAESPREAPGMAGEDRPRLYLVRGEAA